MTIYALFIWFVIAAAVIGWLWGIHEAAHARLRRRYEQQERDAAEASGDLDRLDELEPWLLDLFAAAAEDVTERLYQSPRLVWSQPEVTAADDPPIYLDALAWSEAARADWDEPTRWGQA